MKRLQRILLLTFLLSGAAMAAHGGTDDSAANLADGPLRVEIVTTQKMHNGMVELPFNEIVSELLSVDPGIAVVDNGSYDVLIEIKATGKCVGANYSGGGWLYTGGEVKGSITLSSSGKKLAAKDFRGVIFQPQTVQSRQLFKTRPSAALLIDVLETSDFNSIVYYLLGSMRPTGGLEQLIETSDPSQRAAMIEALGFLPNGRGQDLLFKLIVSESASDRAAAAIGLGRSGNEEAVLGLIEQMEKDVDLNARLSAMRALGMIRDKRAFEPLMTAYETSIEWSPRQEERTANNKVKSAAHRAMTAIMGTGFISGSTRTISELRKWWKKNKNKE